ncbi:extracellular solute-binding protein [Thorsellia anophelis]|uniref:Multiple sugar transport system substrate-binding protein n=1 Tax=Thorsellia anophelis DSM 18579 TaxID=1123402 RepID=A0A1I0DZ24_9GAMM|nr:extracellular solute-binding protein [Thorsellia anophelis]SET37956.1 multiple sugar transport system substrate-binding protein [Thorsellia anophelis DSM 18579]
MKLMSSMKSLSKKACLVSLLVGSVFSAYAQDVKIVYWESEVMSKYVNQLAEEYKKINPDINIIAAPIVASESDYYAKLSLLLKTDPSIGIVREDTFSLRANVAGGFYAPIEGIADWSDWGQFYEGVKEAGSIDGQLYGIPFTSDTRGIFFNRPIMRELGYGDDWQPKSWDDILTTARQVKEKFPDVLPFWFYAGMGEESTMQTFQMFMYGTDDEMFENGKWVAESKGMRDSFKMLQDMTQEGLSAKPSLATNQQAGKTIWEKMFAEGKVAMLLGGGWNTFNFKHYNKGRDAAFEDWGLAKMPKQNGDGFTSMSGGYVLSIPSTYEDKQAALDVIKFMTNKDNLTTLLAESGELSPRMDVAQDEAYKRMDPLRVEASKFLEFTHFRPTTEDYPKISTELQRMVEAVVVGDKTPEEATIEYGKKVEKTVGSENVIRKAL